jgi:CDP-diacylglycerol--glycerol-3-phosphate 3-phosphatidyltransferase
MNLPNKLTIFRVFLIPIFLFFYLQKIFFLDITNYIALFIFIIACITDAMDGYIARKHNLITNFGKFADPLADKLLVCGEGKAKKDLAGKDRQRRSAQAPKNNVEKDGDLK